MWKNISESNKKFAAKIIIRSEATPTKNKGNNEIEISKELFSFVSSVVEKTNLEGELAKMLLKELGDSFTYPAYDESSGKVVEKHPDIANVIEAINKDNATELTTQLVFELGHAEEWYSSKVDNAKIEDIIGKLLKEEKTAKRMMFQLAHLFDYELEGVLQSNKELMEDEEDNSAPNILDKLIRWCIALDTTIRYAENRQASSIDYNKLLMDSMRNLFIIKQATEIHINEVAYYLDIVTKDNKKLNEVFKGAVEPFKKELRKESDPDGMFG